MKTSDASEQRDVWFGEDLGEGTMDGITMLNVSASLHDGMAIHLQGEDDRYCTVSPSSGCSNSRPQELHVSDASDGFIALSIYNTSGNVCAPPSSRMKLTDLGKGRVAIQNFKGQYCTNGAPFRCNKPAQVPPATTFKVTCVDGCTAGDEKGGAGRVDSGGPASSTSELYETLLENITEYFQKFQNLGQSVR